MSDDSDEDSVHLLFIPNQDDIAAEGTSGGEGAEDEEEEEDDDDEEEEEGDDEQGDEPPENAALVLATDVERYLERKMNARLRALVHKSIVECMRKISNYTQWLLEKIPATHPDIHRLPTRQEKQRLQRCYDSWYELWIAYSPFINELRYIRIPPLPDTPPDELDADGLRKIRSAIGEDIFPQLCRMWYLIHYGELVQQRKQCEQQQRPADAPILTTQWSLSHTTEEFWRGEWTRLWPRADNEAFVRARIKNKNATRPPGMTPLWNRPVITYTQYEVYQAVMLMTEEFHDYPCCNETLRMIMILFTRVATFFCQAAPGRIFDKRDMRKQVHPDYDGWVPNRKFIMWCNIYFNELLRRVFYLKLMASKRMLRTQHPVLRQHLDNTLIARVCAWTHDTLERIGEEEFEDLFVRAANEHYTFMGDDAFIRYSHSEGSVSRGDTLMELRPGRQGHRYHSDEQISFDLIMAKAKQGESHLDRIILLMAIDNYFGAKGLSWRDLVVIDQCDIEQSVYQLKYCPVPMLIYVYSRPWVYFQKRVLMCEDIYETLAAWFLLVHYCCDNQVFQSHIGETIETIFTFEIPEYIRAPAYSAHTHDNASAPPPPPASETQQPIIENVSEHVSVIKLQL